MKQKYQITLTKEQLQAIQTALNCTFRFKMGQCGEMVDHLQDVNGRYILDNDLKEDIETLVKPKLGLSPTSYIGVNRLDSIDEMVTIHDCIRNFLSWEIAKERGLTDGIKRDWNEMWTVNYDKPTNYFGGLVEIKKLN